MEATLIVHDGPPRGEDEVQVAEVHPRHVEQVAAAVPGVHGERGEVGPAEAIEDLLSAL